MDNYCFLPTLYLRTPLYNLSRKCVQAALKDEQFKMALFLATRSFYKELEKKSFDYSLLNEKQRQTVKKYLNRAIFRSTPFGLFSCISIARWQAEQQAMGICLSDAEPHIRPDFAMLHEIWQAFLKEGTISTTRLRTNDSFWCSKIDLRFIKKEIRGNNAFFSLVSLENCTVVKSLLKYCVKERSFDQIHSFLARKTGASTEEVFCFVKELVQEQALVPGSSPNITGADYADRLSELLKHRQSNGLLMTYLNQPEAPTLSHLSYTSERLADRLASQLGTDHYYCISERKVVEGGLSSHFQKAIGEGLWCLNILSESLEPPDLKNFKRAFIAKYDTADVPLLEVMDAQFGIGYSELEQIKVSYGFSSSHRSSGSPPTKADTGENKLAAVLFNEWQLTNDHPWKLEINITDEQLQTLATDETDEHPPSISVMFRTLDEKIFIESAGGASALSLIGRFGINQEFLDHAKLVAKKEQELNPEVVFAEIAHVCNLHTANVNRRPVYYDYEIPLLTRSLLPEKQQIPLSDITVSVSENTVVLRSRRLKKRIIPRLSSAFNHQRSSFPIFRFLCDVQFQGLKSRLHFSLAELVPGLRFYPRVSYRSCILQLAEWHLSRNDLASFQIPGNDQAVHCFRRMAKALQLPRYFAYCNGDNFLVIDANSADDISFFIEQISGRDHVLLKEFPFVRSDKATVIDSGGCPLLPQFVASLYLQKETYKEVQNEVPTNSGETSKSSTRDWVYFKIFCHPLSSDRIISGYIFPLVRKLMQSKQASRWFWIRYTEGGYHLRLRVKTTEKCKAGIIKSLSICLERLCQNKLVDHFQMDTYRQERKRYSPLLIESVESVFEASSYAVAKWLAEKQDLNYEDERVMVEAVHAVTVILDIFEPSLEKKAGMCKLQFEAFFRELKSPRSLKGELEKLFRRLQLQISAGQESTCCYKDIAGAITGLKSEHERKHVERPDTIKLAADIIHMHLNRLFVYDQRYFEMITYFLLYRNFSFQFHKPC